MINEYMKVGDEVKTTASKKPVTITEVGKHFAHAIGVKGRKWMIIEENGKLRGFNARSGAWCEVLI